VGTDHGALPMVLLLRKQVPMAVLSDRVPALIERLRPRVQAWELQDRVSLRVGDGLSVLLPDECSSLVLAGMGAGLMQSMFSRVNPRPLGLERLVLQPNTCSRALVQNLTQLGYGLIERVLVRRIRPRSSRAVRREQGRADEILVFEAC
jgi:tRNA (adenine22-N1)-methyltransferase